MSQAQLISTHVVELYAGDEYSFALSDYEASEVYIDGDFGLFSADCGYIQVLTGQRAGMVAVTAEEWTAAPSMVADDWEDMAELSITARGPLRVSGSLVDPPSKPYALLARASGCYRVRIASRGRDVGAARNNVVPPTTILPPVEFFLIQCWPSETLEPPVTIKSTTAVSRVFESAWSESTTRKYCPLCEGAASSVVASRTKATAIEITDPDEARKTMESPHYRSQTRIRHERHMTLLRS